MERKNINTCDKLTPAEKAFILSYTEILDELDPSARMFLVLHGTYSRKFYLYTSENPPYDAIYYVLGVFEMYLEHEYNTSVHFNIVTNEQSYEYPHMTREEFKSFCANSDSRVIELSCECTDFVREA